MRKKRIRSKMDKERLEKERARGRIYTQRSYRKQKEWVEENRELLGKPNKRVRWTEEDIAYLLQLYDTTDLKTMALTLERTPASVKNAYYKYRKIYGDTLDGYYLCS